MSLGADFSAPELPQIHNVGPLAHHLTFLYKLHQATFEGQNLWKKFLELP
jgi:hypothetical protein